MGKKIQKVQTFKNLMTGEVRVFEWELDEDLIWESVVGRWGESARGDIDAFDNENCNVTYYMGYEKFAEYKEREGLNPDDEWELQ